jgi:hypothetical protein
MSPDYPAKPGWYEAGTMHYFMPVYSKMKKHAGSMNERRLSGKVPVCKR